MAWHRVPRHKGSRQLDLSLSMAHILRLWWPILIAIALVQIGNGLSGTLVSITSEAEDLPPWLQGLVLSCFYIGSVAGAVAAPTVISRSSHVMSFIIFTSVLAF